VLASDGFARRPGASRQRGYSVVRSNDTSEAFAGFRRCSAFRKVVLPDSFLPTSTVKSGSIATGLWVYPRALP
jgi:hypothetical protein